MGISRITTDAIQDNSITTAKTVDSIITADKIADGAISGSKLAGLTGLDLPLSCVIQVQHNSTIAQTSVTDNDMIFIQHNITKLDNSSNVYITGVYQWSGDNPNGRFLLRKSYDGSNWTDLGSFGVWDEDPSQPNFQNLNCTPFSWMDTEPSPQSLVYYRLEWSHVARNGGTMWMNRPFNGDNLSWVYNPSTSITLMEIKS